MPYFGNEPAKSAIKVGDNTVLSATIANGVIINEDIKSDAAIAMSKTALVAGTGITLATNTLNVDAAQTQITSVGTLTGLTVASHTLINPSASTSSYLQFATGGTTYGYVGSESSIVSGGTASDMTIGASGDTNLTLTTNGAVRATLNSLGTTFVGDVSLDNSGSLTRMTIENNTESNILFTLGGANKGQLYADSNGISIRSESSVPLLFKTNGNTTALTLGTDQLATFAGNILGNGRLQCAVSLDATFAHELFNSHSTGHGLKIRGGSTGSHYSLYVADYNQSNALFYVMGNGDATFTGTITNTPNTSGAYAMFVNQQNSAGWGLRVAGGTDNDDYIIRGQDGSGNDKFQVKSGGNIVLGDDKLLVNTTGQTNINVAGISGWGTTIHNAYDSSSDVYVYLGYANSSGRNSGMNITMDDANANEYLMSLNSGGTERFNIEASNGYIVAPGVYSGNSSQAVNVAITTGGSLVRSTSAKKYKKDIKPYNIGLSTLKQFKPITYKSKNEEDTKVYAGMLADDIHDLGLSEFVQYGEDEEVEGLSYDRLVTVCVNAIKELSAKVTALENA